MIIPYPLSESNKEYMQNAFSKLETDFTIFSLAPSLEIALQNRGSRELDDWELDRIKYHYKIGISKLSDSIIIDNSNQTPEETVSTILEKL